MRLVNPDKLYPYEARQLAVSYVTHRIPEILNWTKKKVGTKSLVWFFQWPLPGPTGLVRLYDGWRYRPMRPSKALAKVWSF